MARVGGRNAWIAVPIGLICAAIVALLAWLALPMGPVLVQWSGDMLRNATTPAPVETPGIIPAERAAEPGDFDCRELYPDPLWSELTWYGAAVLSQSRSAPATDVPELVDALQPDVRVSCGWRLDDDRQIVTTLAVVGADATLVADPALRGQGFSCETNESAVRCQRERERVVESVTVRDGLWLSSVESGWHPESYTDRLSRYVWGDAPAQP